jgi:Ca2+-binding EF-hand superfamily protein
MPPPTLTSTRVAPVGQPPVARKSTVYVSGRKEKAISAIAAKSQVEKATELEKSVSSNDAGISSKSPQEDTAKKQRYEVVIYFTFAVLFCVSAFINTNVAFFWFRNAVSNVLMSKDVGSVIGRDSFWDFAANSDTGSFLSNFFAEIEQFDSSSNVSIMNATTLKGSIFLISPMRIRTLRVVPGRCFPDGFNAANLSHLFHDSVTCQPNFELGKESKLDYGDGQKFLWSQDPLFARSLLGDFGELAYYPSGGFSVDVVANNALEAAIFLRKLQRSGFLDGNSSYVAIEFNVFAPLSMAYLPTRIYFEFPSIGGAIMGTQLSPATIFRYATSQGRIIQGIDALLIVYFILSSLVTAWAFWKNGCLSHLKRSGWNTFDFASGISLMVNLGLRFNMNQAAQALNLADTRVFTEISMFVTYERAITAANAFTLLMVLVKVCFFYGWYVPKATLILSACRYAFPNLIICSCVLAATFIAFAAVFFACFSSEVAAYRTLGLACLAMLKALMGNTDDMIDIPKSGFPIIGPILICSFSISMYFILVNLFAAILVDAFAATKNAWKQREKDELMKRHSAQKQIVEDLKKKFEDDLSGDEVIDRNELQAIVNSYRDLLGFDSVEEFLRRYDENGDGVITRNELIPVLQKLDTDLEVIKNESAGIKVGAVTNDGIIEIFESFDQSMNEKLAGYTESLMRLIEQRSFAGGGSASMGMGFEGGQGIISPQPNHSRDMLSSQDNLVASLIGTVKAKSQFLSIKKRHAMHLMPNSNAIKYISHQFQIQSTKNRQYFFWQ